MDILKGKIAIITGGASGIGRATARLFAQEGAAVVIADIDEASGKSVAREIESSGGQALFVACDVTRAEDCRRAVDAAVTAFGGVDILFNNAGTGIGVGPFLDTPSENWDLSWQVNVKGMMEFCKAVIPKMIERGGGSIINNASLAGLGAGAGYGAYTVTKFAVVGLTKLVAAEFGRQNIRCNATCPGNILTDMGEEEIRFISMEKGISMEEARQFFGEVAAMGRAGQPEEVADVVAYLAGPRSGFLTGVALPVAGGLPLGI
jgi:NAD(P)-dependent dehydrogenase (short-subunit alcohol dehydrogenase family)